MPSKPFRRILLAALAALTLTAAVALFPAGTAEAAGAAAPGPMKNNPNDHIRPVVDSKYYCVIVDKETQVTSVLRQDANGEYTIIDRQFLCSTGVPPRTSPGIFKMSMKQRWLYSPPKNGRPLSFEPFAICFNRPIWFHGTVYDKRDPNTLETDSYQNLGQPVSAGCVRHCVRDAKWLYVNCPAGTVVKVVKSGGPAPICVEPLPELPAGATYDPTDPSVTR